MKNSFILEKIVVGDYQVNCYLFGSANTKEAAVIDPGAEYQKITRLINKADVKPIMVINTHGHFDHIGADAEFGLPIFIHKADADCLTNPGRNMSTFLGADVKTNPASVNLSDGELIEIGDVSLRVIHTPGHTPGGICLAYGNIIFTGDTLFYRGVGRTDFLYASHDTLIKSIKERLFCLDDSTKVYPGHGPASNIGDEKRLNEFL